MCNVITCDLILGVLKQAIISGDVFTAYDITLRARGKTDDGVPHSDVRDIVRNEFVTGEMESYGRDLCELTSAGSPTAFVYFPDSKKSSDHLFVEEIITDDGDDTVTDDADDESETVGITADCRIDIPKKILAKVDAPAGSYDVIVNGTVKCRIPAKDGRVRLGLKKLGGLAGIGKCDVAADSNTNTITVTFV